jgi:alpha-1,2-glucosyltransferase
MRFLLEWGADPHRADGFGVTPLHVAAALDYPQMTRFLLDFLLSPPRAKALLLLAWPYAAAGASFLAFVALNGGIVVGDRSSHEACLNAPQLFYFLSFL